MLMSISDQEEMAKENLLEKSQRILSMAKEMGVDVRSAEKLFDDLSKNSFPKDKVIRRTDQIIDLVVIGIMDILKTEFIRYGLEGYDVEAHFMGTIMDLKHGTSESIGRAQKSLTQGKSEAERLKNIKDETLDMVLEVEDILDDIEPLCRGLSTKKEYGRIKASVEESLKALDWGNYELALQMSRSSMERAKELRDIKPLALRSAAKAGHIVKKVRKEKASLATEAEFNKFDTLLSSIKHLLEKEDYRTALLLSKEVKHEAEMLFPSDKTGVSTFVCPICFDTKCPDVHCGLDITPSILTEETCRTHCDCGTFYHICCVQEKDNFICVSCYTPLGN